MSKDRPGKERAADRNGPDVRRRTTRIAPGSAVEGSQAGHVLSRPAGGLCASSRGGAKWSKHLLCPGVVQGKDAEIAQVNIVVVIHVAGGEVIL